MKVTLQDIAQLAGVSRSTASRALRDSPLISLETRRRVQAIAREHNYQANLLARNLRLQQSNTVAFVITLKHGDVEYLSDPFLLKFIGETNTALRRHGYDMLITQMEEESGTAGSSAPTIAEQYIRSGRADGLILLGRSPRNEEFMADLPAGTPVVFWGPALPGEPWVAVGVDNVAAVREAVQHLIQRGRRRIAYLGNEDCVEAVQRGLGYQQALQEAGLPIDEALFSPEAGYTSRGGHEGMKRLLQQAPDLDAVFAMSDVLAIGAMAVLREAGRRVPEDVAVVGFDNIPLSAYTSPTLTTVSQNLGHGGAEQLVTQLLRQIQGQPAESVIMPHRLIVRQSS